MDFRVVWGTRSDALLIMPNTATKSQLTMYRDISRVVRRYVRMILLAPTEVARMLLYLTDSRSLIRRWRASDVPQALSMVCSIGSSCLSSFAALNPCLFR